MNHYWSITKLQEMLSNGEITSQEMVTEAIQKSSELKQLNSLININKNAKNEAKECDEFASKGKSKGPLHGVLIVVKDNIHVAGIPNTAGTRALENYVPQEDSPVVAKLRGAGAIVLAKSNMHELAFGISGYNEAFYEGEVGIRNAFDSTKIAGGSSSGTGASIGSGIVVTGLGTDTGGSIRIPAALNGVVGFRPTVGRYPKEGVTPISHTRDTIGLMANTVEDVALLDSVITESDKATKCNPSKIKLGVIPSLSLNNLTAGVKENWVKSLAKLQESGIEIVNIENDYDIASLNAQVGFPLALYEAHGDMVEYLKINNTGITLDDLVSKISSPDVKALYEAFVVPKKIQTQDGDIVDTKPIYEEALNIHRPKLIQAYKNVFKTHQIDALLFPTTPSEAIDADESTSSLENFLLFIQNTDLGSNAGIPGLSIPMGMTKEGLPVGIEIDALAHEDEKLLSIGETIDDILNSDRERDQTLIL